MVLIRWLHHLVLEIIFLLIWFHETIAHILIYLFKAHLVSNVQLVLGVVHISWLIVSHSSIGLVNLAYLQVLISISEIVVVLLALLSSLVLVNLIFLYRRSRHRDFELEGLRVNDHHALNWVWQVMYFLFGIVIWLICNWPLKVWHLSTTTCEAILCVYCIIFLHFYLFF